MKKLLLIPVFLTTGVLMGAQAATLEGATLPDTASEIGRASCWERV